MATPTSNGVVSLVQLTTRNEIDSLIIRNKWGGATGTGVNLTYSFGNPGSYYISRSPEDPLNSNYPNNRYGNRNEPFESSNSLSDHQKTAARNSFDAWSEIANINFVEVTDSPTVVGDIRLARTDNSDGAHAYPPLSEPEAGDIWFSYNSNLNDVEEGTYGYATFLHEIGHSLGLAHTHDLNGGEIADLDIDLTKYSVMSYRSYPDQPIDAGYQQSFFPTTPMLNDIAAIQHIYGANTSTRNGDDVYIWQPGEQILETIWDGGGNDTIDWSNQSTAALINLNAGEWSELGPAYWNGIANDSETLAIAYDVTIENAVGGENNDRIIGNETANILIGRTGDDTLTGESGNDILQGYGGAAEFDVLGGGSGSDTFMLGDDSGVFYTGEGYARITDFSNVDDQIILSGDISQYFVQTDDYNLGTTANDTMLFYQDDAIAIFQDTLEINTDSLVFV